MSGWKYWQAVVAVDRLAEEREELEQELEQTPEGSSKEMELVSRCLETVILQTMGEEWLYNKGRN